MSVWEIFGDIDKIRGWMGSGDCETLYDHASRVSGLIVEIGSYCGRSTRLMAIASPKSKIITIDKLIMSQPESIKKELLQNIGGLNVEFVEGDSTEVGRSWDKKIDLLFVDGDHSFLQVQRDIQNFVPHLKRGHYALFHDADKKDDIYYGVRDAIESLQDEYFDEVVINGGMAVCRKK